MQQQPDILDMINADADRLAVKRARNRERFPKVSGYVDLLNAAGLGPVRVIWCEENGQRAGNRNG